MNESMRACSRLSASTSGTKYTDATESLRASSNFNKRGSRDIGKVDVNQLDLMLAHKFRHASTFPRMRAASLFRVFFCKEAQRPECAATDGC